ncbi:MAG TPA: hypothetical protein VMV95_01175 [Bacillota bacterium]|nr:hypothetical protein [Bacillota bacterium]
MSDKIKVRINNVNLQLNTIEDKLMVFGELALNFHCEGCHELCEPVLKFEGKHPDPRYNCEHCGEPYLINNSAVINPEVQGRESVKLYEKTKSIMEKNKR